MTISPTSANPIFKTGLKDFEKRYQNSHRQKCVTLHVANMDPYTCAHITISYYGLMTKKSSRYVTNLYIRHGDMAVSIASSRKEKLATTLRRMLIVIALYPRFISSISSDLSLRILDSSVNAFLRYHERKYMRLPLTSLLTLASQSMELIRPFGCGYHVTLSSIPSVKASLLSLHMSYITAIQSMSSQRKDIPQLPTVSSWRKLSMNISAILNNACLNYTSSRMK